MIEFPSHLICRRAANWQEGFRTFLGEDKACPEPVEGGLIARGENP